MDSMNTSLIHTVFHELFFWMWQFTVVYETVQVGHPYQGPHILGAHSDDLQVVHHEQQCTSAGL